MAAFELVLFDFDGVACDSVGEQYRAASAVLGRLGKIPDSFRSYQDLTHFVTWLNAHDLVIGQDELNALYWEEYKAERCRIMPGAFQVLKILSQRMKLIVISSAPESYVKERIGTFGLRDFFTEIHGGQSKKVNTISTVCSRLGVEPSTVFFVGDMRSDVDCAREAGVRSILLARRDSPHARYADYHITDINQLLEFF